MNIERLEKLNTITLGHGSHPSVEAGMCAMEAVAWLAGEPHSDAPSCACPTLTRAMIRLNDRIQDDQLRTDLLRPLLPKIIGTRTTDIEVMRRRAFVAADMAVRAFAPLALEKRGFPEWAEKLRALAPIGDKPSAIAGRDLACEARSAAAAYAAYAAADDAAAAADAAYAAYAAAAAADDAAAAADAAYARRPIYELAVQMIEKMLVA